MPISKDKVTIREEQGTPGGVTYWITHNDDLERSETALCFRTLNGVDNRGKGLRCNRPAGMGTSHYGTGACRLHGGNTNITASIRSGKNAVVTRAVLQDKIEEFLTGDSSDLSDLSIELASMRAIFHEFLENFPNVDEDNYGIAISRATKLVAAIGTLLEKISKIENRNTLTAAQAMYLQATVADILLKNISDPAVRDRAVKELTNRMSGVSIGDRVNVIQKNEWQEDNP